MKKTFVSAAQLEQIAAQYPTPFHIYDEQGIRENARRLNAAFSWNPGFREYFAVKATPTPAIMKVLQEEGCGCDCSSLTELMMAERIGCVGEHIVFSSNETPAEDYRLAAKLGAVINLDDLTHVDFLERAIGYIPKKIGCRFNPGGTFSLGETREGFQVMDNPGDTKYGMTRAQIAEAFRLLKAKGAEEFGIHAFLASNTLSNEYYPALARMLFRLAAELQQETGCHITFIASPAASVSRTGRMSRPMTSPSSAKACAGRMRRSLCRPAWVMWRCTPNSAALCSHRTVIS